MHQDYPRFTTEINKSWVLPDCFEQFKTFLAISRPQQISQDRPRMVKMPRKFAQECHQECPRFSKTYTSWLFGIADRECGTGALTCSKTRYTIKGPSPPSRSAIPN